MLAFADMRCALHEKMDASSQKLRAMRSRFAEPPLRRLCRMRTTQGRAEELRRTKRRLLSIASPASILYFVPLPAEPPRDSRKLHFFGVSSSSGLPEDPRLRENSVSVPIEDCTEPSGGFVTQHRDFFRRQSNVSRMLSATAHRAVKPHSATANARYSTSQRSDHKANVSAKRNIDRACTMLPS